MEIYICEEIDVSDHDSRHPKRKVLQRFVTFSEHIAEKWENTNQTEKVRKSFVSRHYHVVDKIIQDNLVIRSSNEFPDPRS